MIQYSTTATFQSQNMDGYGQRKGAKYFIAFPWEAGSVQHIPQTSFLTLFLSFPEIRFFPVGETFCCGARWEVVDEPLES